MIIAGLAFAHRAHDLADEEAEEFLLASTVVPPPFGIGGHDFGDLGLDGSVVRGLAQAFAEASAAVVLADFKEDAAMTAQKLVAAGLKAPAVRCDVSDDAQVAAMVDRTVAESAGSMPRSTTPELWPVSLRSPTAPAGPRDRDQLVGRVELHEANCGRWIVKAAARSSTTPRSAR